ncbi:MAG: hypothetical protein HY719_05340 [Planctomycetes bacterium]|nr:hypothetical protein [Planctomycetota bacterium]
MPSMRGGWGRGIAFLLIGLVFAAAGPGCSRANTKERKPVLVTGTAVFDKRVRGTNNFVTVNPALGVLTGVRAAPARFAKVEAVGTESPYPIYGSGMTDSSGNFSLSVDNNNHAYIVRVYTQTARANPFQVEVVNPANNNLPYYVQSDPYIEAASGLFLRAPINPINCQSPPPASGQAALTRTAPAFNVFDQFAEGANFLLSSVATIAPKVRGIWLDGRKPSAAPVTSYTGFRTNKGLGAILYDNVNYRVRSNGDGTFTLSQGDVVLYTDVALQEIVGEIDVAGDETTDPDHYDDHVLLEAYWRFIQHIFCRDDAQQPEVKSDFTVNEQLDLRVAFSQGFAKFFACAVLRDSIYLDTRAISGCDPNATAQPTSSIDVERQDTMVPLLRMMANYPIFDQASGQLVQVDLADNSLREPRADGSTTYVGLSRGYPNGNPPIAQANYGSQTTPTPVADIFAANGTGYGSELAIAAMLFDLFDSPAQNPTDRLDQDGSRRNPVNGLLIDSYNLGFSPIWQVMTTYISQQTFVYFGDFIDGWYAAGNVDTSKNDSVVAFNNLLASVGVFYRVAKAPGVIGDPQSPGTSPIDTYPFTTALYGASANPLRGNNVIKPLSGAAQITLATHASSSVDPFNSGAALTRRTWRSSSAFYSVLIPMAGRLRIELKLSDPGTGGSDLDLYLYSPNGSLLSSSIGSTNLEVIDNTVPLGVVTFEVRSYQTNGGTSTFNTTSQAYDLFVFRPF